MSRNRPALAFAVVCGLFGIVPFAGAQGVQVNTDPATGENIVGDAANEPTLAISFADPNALVIGWRQFDSIKSDKRFAGFAYSTDGGATWTNGGRLKTPPDQPPDSGQTDPVLAADAEGVFYFWSEVFEPTWDTAQYLYRSTDGGATWTEPDPVENPPIGGDKPWITIDRTGGKGHGNVYGGWTRFRDGDYMVFARSIDGGETFQPVRRIADRAGMQFMLHLTVGPDEEVYAAWRHYGDDALYITKSTNAWDRNRKSPSFDAFGTGGVNGLDLKIDRGHDPGFIKLNPVGYHQIWLGVDPSADGRGWVYCAWADARKDVCDVYFARSTDGGETWETGTRINDDAPGNGAYQWMVAMDVAPTGRIDVTWYDTRDDPDNFRSSLYYSFSLDGGTTWAANRRLTDSFDTTIGWPQQQKIGDYNHIVAQAAAVNIAYAATFNGEQDVWFLRASPFSAGDTNCDGAVDFGDIDPFVLALTGADVYGAVYPDCDFALADINGDGGVDFDDIDPFVELLTK